MSLEADEGANAVTTHPRFRQRLAEVEDQTSRLRKRKLLIFAAVVALVLLAAAATQSPLLDIDEVRVVGAQELQPEQVRQVAAVELGAPVLGLDTDAIEDRVVTMPAVANASVTKSWGGVVTVEIRERPPVARIETLEGVIIIADDRIVIDLLRPEPTIVASDEAPTATDRSLADLPPVELPSRLEGLLEIRGAMFSAQPGQAVPDVLTDAVALAAELPSDVATVTDRIDITVDSLVLRLVGGGSVSVGDARDLDTKFESIRAFLAQVDLSCLDTLNVRAPTVPVIVRNPGC